MVIRVGSSPILHTMIKSRRFLKMEDAGFFQYSTEYFKILEGEKS